MPRHRHLYVLDDSKNHDLDNNINNNNNNTSKTPSKLRNIIKTAREDTDKMSYNLYAISLGYKPPNIVS